MATLGGLIGMFIMAILFGKHAERSKWTIYITIGAIALVQVGIVLFQMLTKKIPVP